MELTILGVNSPYPRQGAATLGYLVTAGGTRLLIEAGCGIYRRLSEIGRMEGLAGIILSHLHYDHCADLPAVVLGAVSTVNASKPLTVFIPPGESGRLREWLGACGFRFVEQYMRPVEFVFGRPVAIGEIEAVMIPAAHSLPAGITTLAAGGKRLVYTGDTGDSPDLRSAMAGADLLLAEVSPLSEEAAKEKGHLTPTGLGSAAREAGVGRLVVTHFMPGSEPASLAEETARSFGGPVEAAAEGRKFEV